MALVTLGAGRIQHFPVRRAWLNATGDPRFDTVMIEHNGVASASDDSFWPDLVTWYRQGGVPVDELIVPGRFVEPSPTINGLYLLEDRKCGYRTPLQGLGPDGIASAISRNERQKLRRSFREYGEGLSLDRAPDIETALDYFWHLKELHIASWTRRGRAHAFSEPFFEAFHRALIVAGMADDNVDLLRIKNRDAVIGYLYNFRRNGVVSAYQSGFADEQPDHRPGYVCHALAIAHYAAIGMTHYDFLAGTNRLKQSFGLEKYEMSWSHYRKPTIGAFVDHWARKAVHVLRP